MKNAGITVEQKPKLSDVVGHLWDVQQVLYDGFDELNALYDKWFEDGDDKYEEPALAKTTEVLGRLLEGRKILCDTCDPLVLQSEILTILAATCTSLESGLRDAVKLRVQIAAMTQEELDETYTQHPVELLWQAWGKAIEDDCEHLDFALLALENVILRRQMASHEMFGARGSMPEYELTDTEQNILTALGGDTLKGPDLLRRAGYDNSSHYRKILSNLTKRRILGRSAEGYYSPGRAQDRSSRP
jgi:hypothetical protein